MGRLARHFSDLDVYQRAADESARIYFLTADFPRREINRLSDQLVRSSRAVPALIAEAWGRRFYTRAFREKLSQAYSEATEVQAWLDMAKRCQFMSGDDCEAMSNEWHQISGMLIRMIQQAHRFKGNGD